MPGVSRFRMSSLPNTNDRGSVSKMKNRDRQRHNRRKKEQLLSMRDICNVSDPTPHEAVKELIAEFRHRNESRKPMSYRDR